MTDLNSEEAWWMVNLQNVAFVTGIEVLTHKITKPQFKSKLSDKTFVSQIPYLIGSIFCLELIFVVFQVYSRDFFSTIRHRIARQTRRTRFLSQRQTVRKL